MSDYGLLWVNGDATSHRSRKKLPAVQSSIINAHSQQYAWRARTTAGHRALRNSSAARGLVGWNMGSDTPGEATTDSHLTARYENGSYTAQEFESSVALMVRLPLPREVKSARSSPCSSPRVTPPWSRASSRASWARLTPGSPWSTGERGEAILSPTGPTWPRRQRSSPSTFSR
jgi:hypothetical protein